MANANKIQINNNNKYILFISVNISIKHIYYRYVGKVSTHSQKKKNNIQLQRNFIFCSETDFIFLLFGSCCVFVAFGVLFRSKSNTKLN